MNGRLQGYRHLDNLLTGLEEEILRLGERELVSENTESVARIGEVREAIDASLQSHGFTTDMFRTPGISKVDERPRWARSELSALVVPSGLGEQRKLLESLAAQRSGIPRQIRMAFSSHRRPSDSEVEAMVERLIRLGILSTKDTMDGEN